MNASGSPEAVFRQNSRSFSLAARLFARKDQQAVARIYRFCRYLDDRADNSQAGDPEALARARQRLSRTLESQTGSIEADFLALADERAVPLDPALELINALREDCGPRSIQTPDDLIRFAYGVAGTVGRMMRHVIDARDPRADAFAIDLGIGFQLTNVARDVAEDAQRGRFYLPATWVEPHEITGALAEDTRGIRLVDEAVRRTLHLSERYYQSARRGFAYIPPRNRRVIFIAAAIYQAIGQKILRSGSKAWRQRTVVSPLEKLVVIVRSLTEYHKLQNAVWSLVPEPTHDAALHAALQLISSPDGQNRATLTPA